MYEHFPCRSSYNKLQSLQGAWSKNQNGFDITDHLFCLGCGDGAFDSSFWRNCLAKTVRNSMRTECEVYLVWVDLHWNEHQNSDGFSAYLIKFRFIMKILIFDGRNRVIVLQRAYAYIILFSFIWPVQTQRFFGLSILLMIKTYMLRTQNLETMILLRNHGIFGQNTVTLSGCRDMKYARPSNYWKKLRKKLQGVEVMTLQTSMQQLRGFSSE